MNIPGTYDQQVISELAYRKYDELLYAREGRHLPEWDFLTDEERTMWVGIADAVAQHMIGRLQALIDRAGTQ